MVEVERVPVDRIVDAAPAVRQDGDVTIIPVMEEVLVVEKRLVLKEELHVRRRRTQESVEVPVTLRRERVEVERLPAGRDPRRQDLRAASGPASSAEGARPRSALRRNPDRRRTLARHYLERKEAPCALFS